ncbi:Zinc transporter [Coemansia spiralis]|uniref:Zinc transporter n=1 Tax=Coemansia spiralis TaxID=417178 RepID=A0A9W8GCD7_9FUNG|nr:Zinc transporter [Coemansia spiralis]
MTSDDGSTAQALLFAMTSGATIYLDPLLHALGMPRDFNVLDSHTVLSAMLAGASGIMAYTSISVLTGESIEYLSKASGWSFATKYPGAVAAVLFIIGAYLNLLLVHLVSYITPPDSPIKHACASHPPSPLVAHEEHPDSHSPHRYHMSGSPEERGSAFGKDHVHAHENSNISVGICIGETNEQRPLLESSKTCNQASWHSIEYASASSINDDTHARKCCQLPSHQSYTQINTGAPCAHASRTSHACRCEYACTKPGCYHIEHCHITPLYPHLHSHPRPHSHAEHNADCVSVHSCPDACSQGPQHIHHQQDRSGSAEEISYAATTADTPFQPSSHHYHHGHGHIHSHSHHGNEPETGLTRFGDGTTSQISSRHQKLLIRVGLQTAVAIALHKIPEGLIIYVSRKASPKLGMSVAASLFFHNLPEGLMLALPLFLATERRNMAFLVASLMGAAPPAIGAALGMLVLGDIGHRNESKLSGLFGVAFGLTSGMMCMVSLNGMLPTARIYDKAGNIVAWCFALGVAAMVFANSTLG